MAEVQRFGTLTIDHRARRLVVDGQAVALTRSEFALLAALAAQPGAAMGNRDLLQAMWGTQWEADTTPLQVHVSCLRRKLGESGAAPRYIETLHGFGYRFEPAPAGLRAEATGDGEDPDDDPADGSVTALMAPDRTIVWISDQVRDLLGWDSRDLVGRVVLDLVHPDDRPGSQQLADLASGTPQLLRVRIQTASGDYRALVSTAIPVVDAGGSVTGYLGVWRSSEEDVPKGGLAPILLAADQPDDPTIRQVTLVYDGDLVLREVTPSGPILGWPSEHLVGTTYSPTGVDVDTLRTVVAALLGTGTLVVEGPITVKDRAGQVSSVHATTHLMLDDDGEFAGLRSVLRLPVDSAEASSDG